MASGMFGDVDYSNVYNANKPMDMNSQGNTVMQGVQSEMTPYFNQANTQLQNREFGGGTSGIYSPSIQASVMAPVLQKQTAEVGNQLQNIYTSDRNFNEQKREFDVGQKNLSYQNSESQNTAKRAQDASQRATVLCTAMYRQGLFTLSDMKYDLAWAKYYCDKTLHANYLHWATPIADYAITHRWFALLIYPIVKQWSNYMKAIVKGTKQPIIGKTIHTIGVWYSNYRGEKHYGMAR
jgi:hypothetical protein